MFPAFGLNRFDFRSPEAFAADVARAELLGWSYAFIPSSPLLLQDPYVMLAAAAAATQHIGLGPLIENPRMRHPAVLAGSIATLDALAPGRTMLGLGAGDTAVRLAGRRPARVAELEAATRHVRRLLSGERVDLGAREPAQLRHARPVPVWVAAGGPRTLRMAGRVADGVFVRVGRHPSVLRAAVDAVREGARGAGRDPGDVRLGAVFHTVVTDDHSRESLVGRSIAAGYYEYSPLLFERAGLAWEGPPVEELKRHVWPDFHHARDLVAAGTEVAFLSDEAVDAFCLHGPYEAIARQLRDVLDLGLDFEIVVAHPVEARRPGESGPRADFVAEFARHVIGRSG